jgi:hypothetical protein
VLDLILSQPIGWLRGAVHVEDILERISPVYQPARTAVRRSAPTRFTIRSRSHHRARPTLRAARYGAGPTLDR